MKKRKLLTWLNKKKRVLLFAKFLLIFLVLGVMQVSASEYSNSTKFTIKLENASILKVLAAIQSQSDFEFFYSDEQIDKNKKIDIDVVDATVEEVLELCFKGSKLTYEIVDKVIIIKPVGQKESPSKKTKLGISGKVMDEDGEPLPGATVIISGTNKGITTNDEGQFTLVVPSEATILRVSFIGFETKMIKVGEQRDFTIVLNETATDLGEVVVTGYQTLPKERVTGSFGTIGEEELTKAGSNFSLKNKLEDLIPGLYFQPHFDEDTDAPEEDSKSIVIRGINTFGDNNPLIVVDGFPMDPDVSDPWTTINPDDVKNVTVLKDASAASIWGAQAANGVIVIETKKGDSRISKPMYNVSIDYVSKPKPDLSKIPWANSEDAVDYYRWLVLEHDWFNPLYTSYYGGYDLPEVMQTLIDMKAGNITEAAGNSTLEELSQLDVRDEFSELFLRPETMTKINLSMVRGGKFHKTRTSVTANVNNSYSKGNSDYNILANIQEEYSIAKWLKFSVRMDLNLSKEENNGVNVKDLFYIPQHSRILDDNGNYLPMIFKYNGTYGNSYYDFPTEERRALVEEYNLPYSWDWNLKQDIDNRDNTEKSKVFRINSKLVLTPIKPLSIELYYQYTDGYKLEHHYYNEESWIVRNLVNYNAQPDGTFPVPQGGMLHETKTDSYSHDARLQFIFNKKIGLHEIKVLGGTEWRKDYYETIPYAYYGYDPQSLTYITSIDFASDYEKINGDIPSYSEIPWYPGWGHSVLLYGKDNRYISYYGNMGYTFQKKYDLTASIRLDKTNLYGQSPTYRNLPQWSVGLGWTLSKEKFLKKIKSIDKLRLRASYGFNGHIDKSASPYIYGTSRVDKVNQLPYACVTRAPNPDLTWEKTKVFNIGVDFALFQNKLKGSLEYYSKNSSDVLVSSYVNPTYGFYNDKATANMGDIKNTGIELNVSGTVMDNKNFTWRSTFILATNKNMTSNYNGEASAFTSHLSSPYSYPLEGQPVSYMAAMRWAGYDENGLPQFYYGKNTVYSVVDAPSYSTIEIDSVLSFVGQKNPKVYGSFITSLSYKNFELTVRLSYKFGHKFWDNYTPDNMAYTYLRYNMYYTFLPGQIVNRWKSPDDVETASMYSLNEVISTSNVRTLINYASHYNDQKVLNAGQIRLQSINLAYNLPASLIKGFRRAVIQVEARNLGCLWVANKKGIDPSNPPNSGSYYGALRFVTRYRPEFLIGLKLGF